MYGLSQWMHSLGRCYARYVNRCCKRTGSAWEGRLKSSLIQTGALDVLRDT